MKNTTVARVPAAPRLRPRRLARAYFFPWSQPIFTSALAVLLWLIKIPWPIVLAWWSATLACFILQDLSMPQSRLTRLFYWAVAKANLMTDRRQNLAEAHQVYTLHPDPPLFKHRHWLRWRLSATVILLTWPFTAYQSSVTTPADLAAAHVLLTVFLFAYGLVPYGDLVADRMRHAARAWRYFIWASVGLVGAGFGLFSFYKLGFHWLFVLTSVAVFVLLYTAMFLLHRFSAGERALMEVIREVSLELLAKPQVSEKLSAIPELLHIRLRHDRVFILNRVSDQELAIVGQAGDYPSVLGRLAPIATSLTGKAFADKTAVVWNDVRACPYYHRVHPNDDTLSEIAVPIVHQGVVFGVLDVQSRRHNVYGPADVTALESIARILGAAIAVERQDEFYGEAVQLWERVLGATGTALASEKEVFNLFASFAQEKLGADLVLYFPLSLSGCPVATPYVKGKLKRPDLLRSTHFDSQSSIIQLVTHWKPYYEEIVTENSLVFQPTTPGEPGFVTREEIQSTCFIPVGIRQERLGALFLNFRQPKQFDKMFQFIILSLAQSLAKTTAQVRYRNMVFKGFGRPEFVVHNIVNRYGFKENVLRKADNLWRQCDGACGETFAQCVFNSLFEGMENFVREILLVESSIPPDFWQEGLKSQLEDYGSMRPARADGRRSSLRLRISPEIERESPWVKLALYRVITEATNNAILHGNALHIQVEVRREARTIEALVLNDGAPLPEAAHKKRSKDGIYAVLEDLERELGAKTTIDRRDDEPGTFVSVSIPALPLSEEIEV